MTKAQVGLGNVDNTADEDKPVKDTITATKAEGYKLAMSAVTGLTTLVVDTFSGPVLVQVGTSAAAPSIAAGDVGAVPLKAGQGWSGQFLAERFPDAPTATYVFIRARNAQASVAVRYA